jgi:hypothetical protein
VKAQYNKLGNNMQSYSVFFSGAKFCDLVVKKKALKQVQRCVHIEFSMYSIKLFSNGHLVANGCLVRAAKQDVHFYLVTKTKRWQHNLFHLCNMHRAVCTFEKIVFRVNRPVTEHLSVLVSFRSFNLLPLFMVFKDKMWRSRGYTQCPLNCLNRIKNEQVMPF